MSLNLNLPRKVSKKQQIYEALLARIQDDTLPVGTRLPNTTILAEEWNVAQATAHAALNELMRDGWLERYPKQGTFVSRPRAQDQQKSLQTLAVVLPPREDIVDSGNGDEVFEMLQGLMKGSVGLDWRVRIEPIPSRPTEKESQHVMESIRHATAVAFIGESQYRDMIEKLDQENFPVIALNGDPGCGHAVIYERSVAVGMGVQYLIDQGCQRIGYVGGGSKDEKLEHYEAILKKNGLTVSQDRICHYRSRKQIGEMVRKFFETCSKSDAVFVGNYRVAALLAQEARHAGFRIPQDLAMMAYGIESSDMDLKFSYVRVPYLECGIEAMKLIADLAKESFKTRRKITAVSPELILREST